MKKFLTAVAVLTVAGCTAYDGDNTNPRYENVPQTQKVEVLAQQNVPIYGYQQVNTQNVQTVYVPQSCPYAQTVSKPCGCSNPLPNREVQHPRIKEAVAEQPRRKCPMDGQAVNCGCGMQKTFETSVVTPSLPIEYSQNVIPVANVTKTVVRDVVPAMPEAYTLASNRVAGRFLSDTASIYTQKPFLKLYVKPAKALSDDLPGGIEDGIKNFKNKITSSYTFDVVNKASAADYYIETTADWFDTPSKSVPAILYKSTLYDKKDNKVKEWVEIIKKADNSQSWL